VGLGKTIEAGLILHQLIQAGKVSRALLLVPDSLVYQWFVEMLKKFNLNFTTINNETDITGSEMIFDESQFFVISLKFLMRTPKLLEQSMQAKWDMVIIDEAHQLKWSPEQASPEYQVAEAFAQKTRGLLLLSGTPEILGLAGHFSRLKLLDPHRFQSYDLFLEENLHYQKASAKTVEIENDHTLSPQEKKIKINELIDRHGTGRVYFRNTRRRMSSFLEFFPKRILHPIKINIEKKPKKLHEIEKVLWLAQFLNEHKNEKTLLLTHDKEMVENLEKKLKDYTTSKIATFHSGMPLVQRDRQAVYFSEADGAHILLCTEIGSEGRNFEFAKNLILFDLPKLPDLLEQRIGRLDRIGQKNDIHLFVPYFENTSEEALFRWYHEGLNAFIKSPRGATEIYAHIREEWNPYLQTCLDQEKCLVGLDEIINKTKAVALAIEEKLDLGQDRLIELNSFDFEKASSIVDLLKTEDQALKLKPLLLNIFNQLGVEVDDINDKVYFIRPSDNMYMPVFPSLPSEGMMITFDRAHALIREDIAFITWDHPMVKGIMELIESKEMGNVVVATWKNKAIEPFLFEAFLVLSTKAPPAFGAETFFPPTPIRVLLNSQFQDKTKEIPKKKVDQEIVNLPPEKRESLKQIPKDFIKKAAVKSAELASLRAKQYKDQFKLEMQQTLNKEILRLQELREINPSVRADELELLRHKKEVLEKSFDTATVYLDSIRIIF
jgi:ATP-dependent helicase HepA